MPAEFDIRSRQQNGYGWPDIFQDPEKIAFREPAGLCADGLCAWGNVHAGAPIPATFGDVLVQIARRLGMRDIATSENLSAFAVEAGWLKPDSH
jgi:hypothetical protein